MEALSGDEGVRARDQAASGRAGPRSASGLTGRQALAILGFAGAGAFAAASLLAVIVSASGCSTPPPPPPPPAAKLELSAELSQKIDEALDLLNNPNVEEKWRNQLVAAAQSDELARRAAIDRTAAAVKRSYERKGQGQGVLKAAGRRRAFEALDKVGGDDEVALEILKLGSKESDAECCAAAAAALCSRGDESALQGLLTAIKNAKDDPATQERGAQAALKLAKPERRDAFLNAVDGSSRKALTPVVMASLPEPKSAVLRVIAKEHPNPQARILALEQLALAKDPELVGLARGNLGASNADLRAKCLELLHAQGGAVAANELADDLAKDPKDVDAVAKLLATVDAPEAAARAVALLSDGSRSPATRAAVARFVLARVRDPKAPSALRAARETGLTALRAAVNDGNDLVANAAIEALGAAGEESDADALVLLLASTPSRGAAIVGALGKIGGTVAVQTLIDTHGRDAKLRAACREGLVGSKDLPKIAADQGLLLIRQLASDDLDLRKSAVAILKALKGDNDVHDFDPDGNPQARQRSIDKWLAWWKKRLAERGS